MVRKIASICLVTALYLLPGCGSGELGPADPSETPVVSEEEKQKQIKEQMEKNPYVDKYYKK